MLTTNDHIRESESTMRLCTSGPDWSPMGQASVLKIGRTIALLAAISSPGHRQPTGRCRSSSDACRTRSANSVGNGPGTATTPTGRDG